MSSRIWRALSLGLLVSCSGGGEIAAPPDTPAVVGSVSVSPGALSLNVGGSQQLTAVVTDTRGGLMSGQAVAWSSSSSSVASVSSSGSVLGLSGGSATIFATSGSQSGTASVTVTAAPAAVASVAVTPGSATLAVGQAQQLAATPRDAGGNALTGRTVTWTTSSASTATVSSSGLVNAAAAGAATITATSEGQSGTSAITVTAVPVVPTQIAVNAGNHQTATAGSAVAIPPSTIVRDASNNPVAGVTVTFAVTSGGGSITGGAQTTNASGVATLGSWTLGATAGVNTLTATSGTLAGSPLTFTATGAAGVATQIAQSGGSTTGTVGAAVATPPSVVVRDANNNAVSGVSVTFAVTAGGGSITGATQSTNASGIATVGSWTMGATAGTNTLSATAAGLAGSPVVVSVSTVASPATQIAVNGGSVSALAGAAVPVPPAVIVRDATGAPVGGVGVVFAVVSGGGSASGLSQSTNAGGIATVGSWTLGATAGVNTMTATATGLAGSPVVFSATGTAGAATQIAQSAGSTTGAAGAAVTTPPSVIVRDANSNAVSGVNVTFAVASGGGSITGATQSTNASGIATVGNWTLGATAGANTMTATATGLTGSPVTFTATGVIGGPTQLALTRNAAGAASGAAFATQPVVAVRDAVGNTVTTATNVVTMTASAGGTVIGTATATAVSGVATFTNVGLNGTAGTSYTLTFAAAGLTSVSQSITPSAGAATQIGLNAGNGQTATVGTAVGTPPSVVVRDAGNNPVAGVSVTFAVASGGGSVTGAAQTTSASGVAAVGGWTLGATAGANTLTATATGLTGSPVTFTATGAGATGAATQLALTTSAAGASSGAAFATQPVVAVRDAAGATVTSATHVVTMTVSAGGTVVGTATATAVSGVATFTDVGLSGTAGTTYTLTFSATGLASVTQGITVTFGAATRLVVTTAAAGARSGLPITTAPVVAIRDAAGNTVTTATNIVTLTIGGFSGSVTSTAVGGVATFSRFTLTAGAGTYTLTYAAPGLTSATQSLAIVAGTAAQVTSNSSTNQSATVGSAVATPPSVKVSDAAGNGVSGVTVTFAVASGGGSATGTSATTNGSGIAVVGSWTLGATAGTNTMTATATGLTGSPVTFSATGTAVGTGGTNLRIELRYLTTGSAAQVAAFTAAAARWSGIITAKLPDYPLNAAAGQCGSNSPAINETIDDVVIYVTFEPIDGVGSVLGSAGPCYVRGNYLPVVGRMRFDTDDLANMEANGTLNAVILHEMGHVLGIGTIWEYLPGLLLEPSLPSSPGVDTRFVGTNAIAGFNEIGGTTYTLGGKVPVENTQGGEGTRDSHWRESVLRNELMTGFVNSGSNPLSMLTVRSLQDLGYTVDTGLADGFFLTLTTSSVRAEDGATVHLKNDVTGDDIRVLDERGRVLRVLTKRRSP